VIWTSNCRRKDLRGRFRKTCAQALSIPSEYSVAQVLGFIKCSSFNTQIQGAKEKFEWSVVLGRRLPFKATESVEVAMRATFEVAHSIFALSGPYRHSFGFTEGMVINGHDIRTSYTFNRGKMYRSFF
jgi:hypothetical protein